MARNAIMVWLAGAAAAVVLCAGSGARGPAAGAAAAPAAGLGSATAFATAVGLGRTVRLDAEQSRTAFDAVWQVLGDIPAVAPVAGGPRLLAIVRVNEQVLDVTLWKAQTLVIAARRLPDVSAVVIPVTGVWRHRVLIVQTGRVSASPRLIDTPALAAVDDAVRRAIGPR